jgi:hypothetical protein
MSDYDMSIHRNPDAMAWVKFFREKNPDCNVPDDLMLSWFSNAMMAMHDHLQGIRFLCGDQIAHEIEQGTADKP